MAKRFERRQVVWTREISKTDHLGYLRNAGTRIFRCITCHKLAVRFGETHRGGSVARYCSPACVPAQAYLTPRPSRAKPRQEKRCAHCGEPFTPARSDARTCSVRCRLALHHR